MQRNIVIQGKGPKVNRLLILLTDTQLKNVDENQEC
jgi:hypothetical protein